MALTRKFLAAMGIDEAKIDSIIDAHTETVDGLKQARDTYKTEASKIAELEKQLADAQATATGSDEYKAKYEAERKAFADYKADIDAKAAHEAKATAARAYLKERGIADASLALAVRALGNSIDGLELDGDTIKDASALDDALSGDLAPLVTTIQSRGADTATPPASEGNTTGENVFGSTGSYFF